MQAKKYHNGFTLLELLLVLSVVSILATFIILTLRGAEQMARDTRRLADLDTIYRALQLYEAKHGVYPLTSQQSSTTTFLNYQNAVITLSTENIPQKTLPWSSLQKEIEPYLLSLPKDPLNTSDSFYGYVVYLNEIGFPTTLWMNTKSCSLSIIKKSDAIPHRGILFAQKLETPLGNGNQFCNLPDTNNDRIYWKFLP